MVGGRRRVHVDWAVKGELPWDGMRGQGQGRGEGGPAEERVCGLRDQVSASRLELTGGMAVTPGPHRERPGLPAKEAAFSLNILQPLRRGSSLAMPPLYSPPRLPRPPPPLTFLALAFKALHNVELIPLVIRTPVTPYTRASPPPVSPFPRRLPQSYPCPRIRRRLHPNVISSHLPPARNWRVFIKALWKHRVP